MQKDGILTGHSSCVQHTFTKFCQSMIFRNNPTVNLQETLLYFEVALILAVSVMFENAKTYGCWLHFNQALIRFCALAFVSLKKSATQVYRDLFELEPKKFKADESDEINFLKSISHLSFEGVIISLDFLKLRGN
ncbi:hypothetical protein BpHYR1_044565 [Brachionus plicatilis]|uniref:Uncharacterized protein n=1 Tax=Brachionus plicatilis TaxID=10195 RepID=A0A3M7R215_BRAPC|nr:hypothetical protein BpHYR1_044565 [Brachionus plicatilis]